MADQIILTVWNRVFLQAIEGDGGLRTRVGEAIAQMKAKRVPVIVFTECDRAEVDPIRRQLNWTDPFITESGSGIFTSVNHNPFAPVLGEQDGDYYVQALGCPYVQARAALRVLANEISHPLKGFGDFTVPKLERFLGVSETTAHRAKAREFSEPFMTPKAVEPDVLVKAAKEIGFDIILRNPKENRFSELVRAGVGVSAAAKQVIEAYQNQMPAGATLKIAGVGRDDDLEVLAAGGSAVWRGLTIATVDEGVLSWVEAIASLFD